MEQCLRDSGIARRNVHDVALIGSSARIPMCLVWHMSASLRVPSRLSSTAGSRSLTARLCIPQSTCVRLFAPPRLARLWSGVRLRCLLYGGHFPVNFAEPPSSSRERARELWTGRRIHSGELPASDAGGVAVEGILRSACDRDD